MGRVGRIAPVSALRGAKTLVREPLPRAAASVGAARLLVADVLAAHDVPRSVLETAVLLASELSTDCVHHATGDEILVEVSLGPDRVQLSVTSSAPAAPGPGVAEHSQQVLDIMAAAWEVRSAGGLRVGWCRVDRLAAEPEQTPASLSEGTSRPARASRGPRTGRPSLRRVK